MIKNNVVVVVIEKSRGNESVGDMWLETKIFDKNEPVKSIMDWAKKRGVTGKIILTIPEEDRDGYTW